jgi:gamma-glutamyltranspeptidase/glutathione hydrolase
VALESAFDGTVRYGLTKKGHSVIGGLDCFGGYQGIVIDPKSGALVGGSDVRKDGLAIGW